MRIDKRIFEAWLEELKGRIRSLDKSLNAEMDAYDIGVISEDECQSRHRKITYSIMMFKYFYMYFNSIKNDYVFPDVNALWVYIEGIKANKPECEFFSETMEFEAWLYFHEFCEKAWK